MQCGQTATLADLLPPSTQLSHRSSKTSEEGLVVFPRSDIDKGLSQLPLRVPKLIGHVRNRIRELKKAGNTKNADSHGHHIQDQNLIKEEV